MAVAQAGEVVNVVYKDTLQIGRFFRSAQKPKRLLVTPIYEEEEDQYVEYGPLPNEEVTEEMLQKIAELKNIKKSDLLNI